MLYSKLHYQEKGKIFLKWKSMLINEEDLCHQEMWQFVASDIVVPSFP